MQQYFTPIERGGLRLNDDHAMDYLSNHIAAYFDGEAFPTLDNCQLVLFGVPEDRAAVRNKGCADAAMHIRRKLYNLAAPVADQALVDLGDLIAGSTVSDTYALLAHIVGELLDAGKSVILLGGSQDLTLAVYNAYASLSRVVNIASVDSRFDLGDGEEVNARNYVRHIIMQQPNYLFHYTHVGYQSYFVGTANVQLMDELRFSSYPLAEIQRDVMAAEPLLRNADIVTVDMGAVRQSDAPANGDPSPHGFYGEQLCQLMRFAGMSDKNSLLLFSELNPLYDRDEQTAHLAAHALWFYIQGFYARMGDFPYVDRDNYKRYMVQVDELENPICFFKSKRSDRWWMEVPCDDEERRRHYGAHLLIPCSYADYEHAMENDLPPLWMQYYRWINDPTQY